MTVRPRRVLIVTDVSLVRWALASALGQAGFVALSAETAGAALDTLRTAAAIDAVVVSLSIGPEQAGELLRGAGFEWPGMPVVLLAAEPHTPPAERHEAALLLEQPFSVDDVVAAVENLVPALPDDLAPGDGPPAAGSHTRLVG